MKAGWEVKALGEVIEKVETVDPTKSPDLKFDYVDVSSVSNETFQIEQTTQTLGANAPSRARRKIRTEDVIFATVRPTLQRIAFVPHDLDQQICSTGYMVLRAKASALPKYLYYFLFSDSFSEAMEVLQKGASYPAVTDGEVRDQLIPLPPLDEQKRIVAVLDVAFDGLSCARAHTEANLTNARELFRSGLDFAFSAYRTSEFRTSIASVGTVFDGPHATPKTVDAGALFLGISSLVDGRLDLGETRHVTDEDYAKWTRRVTPKPGDIVFSYETRLGQAAIIPENLQCCLGRRMGLVRLERSKVIPEFFLFQYLAPAYQSYLRSKTVEGATVDRISLKLFPEFEMFVPPIQTQKAVVEFIRAFVSKCEEITAAQTTKLADLDALRQSLLQKAFAGELT